MKVYDSQGRLKVVGFTGPPGPAGTQSVTCAELSATASLLSVAIDVVSNGLSALIVDHNILSNRVSVNSATGGGGGSVTSAEVQVASAAATSADAHANTASAAATSVDARVTSLNTFLASISARSVGVSANGLQSAINAVSNTISNELSARAASVQTASAAATSADAHANTVSARVVSVSAELASLVQIASAAATSADAHANTVSARAVSISAELASLVQIASAAATSADTHANTASAAATSVDARVASLSVVFASLSARSLATSTHGLQSIINALSNHASAASAAATSVGTVVTGLNKFLFLQNEGLSDAVAGQPVVAATSLASAFNLANASIVTHRDVIGLVVGGETGPGDPTNIQTFGVLTEASDKWDDLTGQTGGLTIGAKYYVGNENGTLTLTPPANGARPVGIALTTEDMLIITALVDDWIPFVSALSVRSVGNVSTHGLQSILNALSNRISAVVAGAASATSQEVSVLVQTASAAATSVNTRVNSVNAFLSALSAASGATSTHGLQSVINALSNQISIQAAVAQDGFNDLSNFISAGLVSVDARANQASDAATSVNARVNSVNTFLSGVSARSVGDVSTHGLQSVVDALSARIQSALASASQAAAVAAAAAGQAASAVSVANAQSVRVNSVNTALCAISAVQPGGIPVEGLQSAIDAQSNKISTVFTASTVGSIAALSLAILNDASVSAAIRADEASHIASTSATIKADINSVSAAIKADITSVSAVIKADITSVSAAIINEVSVQFGRGQFKMVTGAQAIATATFTKVSGLSLSIVGSGFYQVNGQLVWSQSGAGSASAIFNFGMSMTAQPVMAMFRMMGNLNPLGASAIAPGAMGSVATSVQSVATQIHFGGNSAICATPSIMYSAKVTGVSGSVAMTMFFEGVLAASTVQSQLKVVAAASTAAFGINIQPGSYIRAFRIG